MSGRSGQDVVAGLALVGFFGTIAVSVVRIATADGPVDVVLSVAGIVGAVMLLSVGVKARRERDAPATTRKSRDGSRRRRAAWPRRRNHRVLGIA